MYSKVLWLDLKSMCHLFQNDCSPIHTASQGKPAIVQLLLEYKCDVNVKDNVSHTHLFYVVIHLVLIQYICDYCNFGNVHENLIFTSIRNFVFLQIQNS